MPIDFFTAVRSVKEESTPQKQIEKNTIQITNRRQGIYQMIKYSHSRVR